MDESGRHRRVTSGYHLRSLHIDQTPRSIDSADVVRVPLVDSAADTYGVQLHARQTPPSLGPEVVMRLTRHPDEPEDAFVKRAFREAAERRRRQLE